MSDDRFEQFQAGIDEQRELHLEHLARQWGADMEPLMDREWEEMVGVIADSRNMVDVARFGITLALLKTYQEGDYQVLPQERAKTEFETLRKLKKKGFRRTPALLSNSIAYDAEGQPVLAFEYVSNLYPLISLLPTIKEELLAEGTSPTVEGIFRILAEFHKTGFIHGDMHLGNVGICQSSGKLSIDDYLLLDMEMAEEMDYELSLTWFAREKDIMYFITDLIYQLTMSEGEEVFDRSWETLKNSFQKGYLEEMGEECDVEGLIKQGIEDAREMWEERRGM